MTIEYNFLDLKRELLLDSFYDFVKWSFELQHQGDQFEESPHYEYMCDAVQPHLQRVFNGERSQVDYIIINIPPRTAKTKIFSVYLPVWCWLHHATKFICNSYASDLSIANNQDARDLIQHPDFEEMFGDLVRIKKGENKKTHFELTHGGMRYCTSTGAKVMGRGCHIAIDDDPMNLKQAFSEALRETAHDHVFKAIPTRFNNQNTALRIVVMQRLHEDDTTAKILQKGEEGLRVMHICLPIKKSVHATIPFGLGNIKTADDLYTDGYLLPNRFNQTVLDRLTLELSPLDFVGQYMQSPKPPEGNMFKSLMFNIEDRQEFASNAVKAFSNRVDIWLDTATKDKTQHDYTAWVVGISDRKNRKLHVLHAGHDKMTADKLPALVKNLHSRFCGNESRVYIEDKASGSTLIQQLNKNSQFNVLGYRWPKNKRITADMDKVSRANGVLWFVAAKRVHVLAEGVKESFYHELEAFPAAKHDDQVDAFVMACADASLKQPV